MRYDTAPVRWYGSIVYLATGFRVCNSTTFGSRCSSGEEEVLWRGDRNEQQNEAMLCLQHQCWENFDKLRRNLCERNESMRLLWPLFSISKSWWKKKHCTRIIGPKAITGFQWNPLPKTPFIFVGVRIGLPQILGVTLKSPMASHPRYVKRETSESPSYVNRLLAALFADEPWNGRPNLWRPEKAGPQRLRVSSWWCFVSFLNRFFFKYENNTNLWNLSECIFLGGEFRNFIPSC